MVVLARGDAIATDLCEALVAAGRPFREAYGEVGALVVRQRQAGKRLVDLTGEDLQALGLSPDLLTTLNLRESARRRAARVS